MAQNRFVSCSHPEIRWCYIVAREWVSAWRRTGLCLVHIPTFVGARLLQGSGERMAQNRCHSQSEKSSSFVSYDTKCSVGA